MDDSHLTPVVTNRPIRRRQLTTKLIPTDIFESLSSEKNSGSNKKEKKLNKDIIYHEGYINGKLYLVPDSTLEAMKDSVNFNACKRKSIAYRHQTSFEIPYYDYLTDRLKNMVQKFECMKSLSGDEEEKDEENIKTKKATKRDLKRKKTEVQIRSKEERKTATACVDKFIESKGSSIITNRTSDKFPVIDLGKQSIISDKLAKICAKQYIHNGRANLFHKYITPSALYDKPYTVLSDNMAAPEIKPHCINKFHFRFLISGHFNSDQTPMYIIQEYNGPKILHSKKYLFFSKTVKEVDMFIFARFFTKDSLEECDSERLALNYGKKRILFDKSKCDIFNDSFNKVYRHNEVNIHLKGEFIKNTVYDFVTPLLTLRVKKRQRDDYPPGTLLRTDVKQHEADSQGQNKNLNNSIPLTNKNSAIVLHYKSKCNNPFYNKVMKMK